MRVDDFDFDLPRELIAERPADPRDSSRLLVIDGRGDGGVEEGFEERRVGDLADLLAPGDMLVFNDTKVIPAQLKGRRGEANISLTLHKKVDAGSWLAFARPAKKLKPGDTIVFTDRFSATVTDKGEAGEVTLAFCVEGEVLSQAIKSHGQMPLPPYIQSLREVDQKDQSDYQTVYAAHEGAVAAPTAGLHFTPELLKNLEDKGVLSTRLTLHVGAGTFLPVKTQSVKDHKMHSEYGEITQSCAAAINQARAKGGRIVAVGTTSLRLLESAADETGYIPPFAADTDIFITPGYRFKAVDLLLTNFHLPRSTLFMLVCAFGGMRKMHAAYAHAIAQGYRFYSYGDACLIHPETNS